VLVLRPFPVLVLSLGLLAAPLQAQTTSPPPTNRAPPDKPPTPAPSGAAPATPAKPATPSAAPAAPTGTGTKPPAPPYPSAPPAAVPPPGAPPAATPPPGVPGAAVPPATGALPALPPPKPRAPAIAAQPAGPPPSPAQVKKARELWYRGVDAFRNGRYEEARQAFSECYTLMPKSDVLRNLSISEIQSGHYVAAARHLTQLLSGVDLPANVREEATRRLAQAEAQIGKLNVTVDVPGAVVNIDGAAIGRTPLDGAWYIEPGQHEVSVSKSGYPQELRQIYALAGVVIPVTVSLEELRREQERDAHAAELMGTREGETPGDRGIGTASTITLISTGTLAAAGFIAGIYFTVSANGHDSDADAAYLTLSDPSACGRFTQLVDDCRVLSKEQEEARIDRRRAQVSFIGAGIASAVTLGYSLYLLLDSDDKEQAKPKTKSAHRLEPGFALGADGASFSLQGQF